MRALVRRLLEALVPPGVGPAALADLERERAERRRALPGRHDAWFAWQAVRVAARLRAGRLFDAVLRRRLPNRSASTPRTADAMDSLARDLRLALRRLVRSPGFAATAVLTLALGVGANVAVFSVVDAVLLEPLPYDEPDELVAIWEWNQPRDRRENVANPGNVRAWAERARTLDAVAYVVAFDQVHLLAGEGEPREVRVRLASPNLFAVLGLEAALGRTFAPGAGVEEGDEMVLTHRYWTDAFGADPSVVGRTLSLANGTTGTVVGVLPPTYVVWGESAELYATFLADGDQNDSGRFLATVARLGEGVTLDRARQELEGIAADLRREHPDFNAGWSVNPVPLEAQVVGDVDGILWMLLAAVGLLLLIACANVANLFLARATTRRREMAVRSSLGASRRTLAGQLLVEASLVAALGSTVGVAVAWGATRLAATRLPEAFALPRVETASVDVAALLFALAVTVGALLLFGLAPALHASDATPGEALAAEGRGGGRTAGRVRASLVVAEVALSVLLLVGAGLVARSLGALLAEDLGIDPEHVVTARVSLATPAYRDARTRVAFVEGFAARLREIPGVDASGLVPFLPLDGMGSATSYWAGDRPEPPAAERPVTDVRNVAGDYFGAMGIGLLRGRAFDGRDGAEGPPAVVVSRALAELTWPGQDPVGRPLVLSWGDPAHVATVVGVVEDVRLAQVEAAPRPAAYYPVAQFPSFGAFHAVVRSERSPAELRRELAAALGSVDPALALGDVRGMDGIVGAATARPRMTALLMAVFAVVAAVLAAVGLYGVLAFTVAQRVREIGLRMALGARRQGVLARVVGRGMTWVGVGLALGVAGALAAGRFLESLLYRVPPTDPGALGGAVVVLALVALIACAVPAWRATRVDPAVSLRTE